MNIKELFFVMGLYSLIYGTIALVRGHEIEPRGLILGGVINILISVLIILLPKTFKYSKT